VKKSFLDDHDDDDGDAFFPQRVWNGFPFHAINTKCKTIIQRKLGRFENLLLNILQFFS
jgi:hypothetical protein